MSKKQAHEIGIPSVCPWTAGACRDSADRVEKCQIYPPHTGAMIACMWFIFVPKLYLDSC